MQKKGSFKAVGVEIAHKLSEKIKLKLRLKEYIWEFDLFFHCAYDWVELSPNLEGSIDFPFNSAY